jgi:hypothetical protein
MARGGGRRTDCLTCFKFGSEKHLQLHVNSKKKGGITRKYKCPLCKKGMKLVGM